MPLYLRVDATLAVAFSSDDFAFGVLPDHAASRLSGRINFPNVAATTPCFHDYAARILRWSCAVKRRALWSLSVKTEAGAAFAELTASPPGWLYDANWNLMRLTERGIGVRDQRFYVAVKRTCLSVVFR